VLRWRIAKRTRTVYILLGRPLRKGFPGFLAEVKNDRAQVMAKPRVLFGLRKNGRNNLCTKIVSFLFCAFFLANLFSSTPRTNREIIIILRGGVGGYTGIMTRTMNADGLKLLLLLLLLLLLP